MDLVAKGPGRMGRWKSSCSLPGSFTLLWCCQFLGTLGRREELRVSQGRDFLGQMSWLVGGGGAELVSLGVGGSW